MTAGPTARFSPASWPTRASGYFVATRIVDLSALINVNTAGDLLARASVTPDAAQDEGLNSPDLTGDIDRNEDNLLYETVGQSPRSARRPRTSTCAAC